MDWKLLKKLHRDIHLKITLHIAWRKGKSWGRCADLRGANLRGADLRYTNLRGADLRVADLRGADLRYTNLRGADLRVADLRYTNLRGADLRGANIDFASLSLGESFDFKADLKICKQLVAHTVRIMEQSDGVKDEYIELIEAMKKFKAGWHRENEF